MDSHPKQIVGRYVRLKAAAFRKVMKKADCSKAAENLFVVAAIARGVNKLICYGNGLRLAVSPCDIVLV